MCCVYSFESPRVHSTYHYCVDRKDIPKLSPLAAWPGAMLNPRLLELPIPRTNFYGFKDVRATEVRLPPYYIFNLSVQIDGQEQTVQTRSINVYTVIQSFTHFRHRIRLSDIFSFRTALATQLAFYFNLRGLTEKLWASHVKIWLLRDILYYYST